MSADRVARFEALYRVTYPAVLAYALRRVAEPADAADVVADTYLTLWRRFDEAPADAMALPWLYGVARRVLANRRRGEARRSAATARLAQELSALPAVSMGEPALMSAIGRALGRLGSTDRELLLLVGAEALNREELAVAVGVSRAVVRVRLFRARQRFTRELAVEGIDMDSSANVDSPSPVFSRVSDLAGEAVR